MKPRDKIELGDIYIDMACHGAGGGQAVSNYSNVHGVAYGKATSSTMHIKINSSSCCSPLHVMYITWEYLIFFLYNLGTNYISKSIPYRLFLLLGTYLVSNNNFDLVLTF